jgi:2-oxoglutarate dehydrogenase E2 component (dihydrolipoamide succinyltransferase)
VGGPSGPIAAKAAPTSAAPTGAASKGASQTIPFDRVRKITAEHMVRSKAVSPHVLQAIDVNFAAVDAVRLAKKEAWKSDKGYSLTYLPFVARAVAMAVVDFPKVNASVGDNELHVHADFNLAIAIDLNHEGLVAPVLKNAGGLSVSELAVGFNDLATRAKSKKLTADDLQGGTYTLSNPGPFGTLFTAPIINQPQVGILSMDAVKKRPHVIESPAGDSIAIRPVGILAHSFDHRAIDGAYSAAYLQRLKTIIETTDWNSEF